MVLLREMKPTYFPIYFDELSISGYSFGTKVYDSYLIGYWIGNVVI